MKPRLCQFGDCQNENVAVTINRHGERVAFCCDEHAALWLLYRAFDFGRKDDGGVYTQAVMLLDPAAAARAMNAKLKRDA